MTTGEKTKTILLVEDEGIIALAETKTLQGYGYKVITAPSGEKAVEIFNDTQGIDLVLMDINLGGGMDGTQAAEIILAQRDIPLIFLSSHTEPEVVEKTEGITSYGYVVKGSGETVLIASIKMAFRLFEARKKEKEKEAALHESETRWRTLIQNLPSFVAEADKDGHILALNRVQPGFSLDDYVGKSLFDVIAPESRNQFQDAFTQAVEKAELVEYEAPGFGANREPAWYHRQLVPIVQDGEVRSILMVANDITERVQTEQALQRSERQLKIITDTIPAYVAYVGLDDLRYRFVNTRFVDSYKIPREQIIGSHIKDIIGQSNYEFAQKYLDIVKQGESTSYENSFVTAGTERWVNVNYVPEMNEAGEPEAVVVLSFDITERKQMENLLKEREERLRMIFDTMTEGVALNEIIYDENGEMVDYRVLEVNQAFYSTADYQGEQVVDNVASNLYGITPVFIKTFWDEHKNKDATAYSELFRPDSNRWFFVATSPFVDDKFVTSFVDITELKQIQEQLRFQAHLLNVVEQAVIVTDMDGHVVHWNPFAEKLYGWSAKEALGKTTIELIASEQSQQQGAEIMARLQAGESWSGEYQASHRDGTPFTVQSTISPAYNDQRELSHIIGLSLNITERKLRENALKNSEEKFRFAMEATQDGLWDWDIFNGDVSYSPGWARIIGEQQLPSEFSTWEDRLHPDDRETALSTLQTHLDGKTEYWKLDHRLRVRDGVWKWVHGRGRVVARDASGKALRMVGTMTDISQRKQTEKALLEAKEYIEHLNNALADAIITVNLPEREIEYVNAATEKVFGYSAEECIGEKTAIFYPGEKEYRDFGQKLTSTIQQGIDVLHIEQQLKRKSGELFPAEITTTFLREEDKLTKVISIVRDITERKQVEKRLRESGEKYRALFESVSDAIFTYDPETFEILDANEATSKLYGYEKDELLGMSCLRFSAEVDQSKTVSAKVLKDGQAMVPYRHHKKKDGSDLYVQLGGYKITVNGKNIMFAVCSNITEQKKVEQALLESEEKYRTLVEKNPIPLCFVNANNELEYFNQGFSKLLGYDHSDVPTLAEWWKLAYPDDPYRQWVMDTWNNAVENSARNRTDIKAIEYLVTCKNGDVRNVEIGGIVLENGLMATFIDVTERKQAEDELERFFNLVPDMVCIASTDGYFKKLNKEWERALGYAQNELLAVPFSNFIHPEDREKTFREVERQITGQHTIRFTNRYRAQDGRYHWFEWNATPSPDGNLLFAAARDITERVQSEHALQEAFEEKQNLLRELQHRAKNSFSLISSLTSLMTDSARGEETRVLLNELGARVRAMSQLYDLLYITEAVAETKLNIYFEQITASFPSTENIRFKQTYETVTVPVKTAAALGLVVTELMTNAMKHAFPGNKQGLISISLRKSDTGARIEVADDGVGFSDGFDSTSSHTLGLTIVQSLTKQIQGNFQIEHGKGTRCIVEFPLG